MTVAELFEMVSLSPCGPVRWRNAVPESHKGVYVIARVRDPNACCLECDLPLRNPLPQGVEIDGDYELGRWLRAEPIVYIGKTDQPIEKRVGQFYQQKCGNRSPHAGGQAILLLNCDLWVFWSKSANPWDAELAMLAAFKKQTGRAPYANFDGQRRPKRIRSHPANSVSMRNVNPIARKTTIFTPGSRS